MSQITANAASGDAGDALFAVDNVLGVQVSGADGMGDSSTTRSAPIRRKKKKRPTPYERPQAAPAPSDIITNVVPRDNKQPINLNYYQDIPKLFDVYKTSRDRFQIFAFGLGLPLYNADIPELAQHQYMLLARWCITSTAAAQGYDQPIDITEDHYNTLGHFKHNVLRSTYHQAVEAEYGLTYEHFTPEEKELVNSGAKSTEQIVRDKVAYLLNPAGPHNYPYTDDPAGNRWAHPACRRGLNAMFFKDGKLGRRHQKDFGETLSIYMVGYVHFINYRIIKQYTNGRRMEEAVSVEDERVIYYAIVAALSLDIKKHSKIQATFKRWLDELLPRRKLTVIPAYSKLYDSPEEDVIQLPDLPSSFRSSGIDTQSLATVLGGFSQVASQGLIYGEILNSMDNTNYGGEQNVGGSETSFAVDDTTYSADQQQHIDPYDMQFDFSFAMPEQPQEEEEEPAAFSDWDQYE